MKLMIVCLGIMVLTGFLSWLVTWFVRRLALKIGFVDRPGERKIHSKPIALGGGVAIYLSLIIIISAGLYLLKIQCIPSGVLEQLDMTPSLLKGMKNVLPKLFTVLGSIGLVMILGLVDDIRGVSVWTKLAVEFLMGCALFFMGIKVTLFMPYPVMSFIATVLWIVLITNSFNLLDNMDGLAGGIAFIGALLLLVVAVEFDQNFVGFITAAFCGALLGFLFHNFYPARIFMGDAGSLSIGYSVSVLTILATYYKTSSSNILPIFIPFFILIIPIFDTVSVVVIRILQKRPIYKGDKSHFSHRLVNLGLTQKRAVLLIYLLCFCLGLPALVIPKVDLVGAFWLFLLALTVVIIIVILEYAASKNHKR